MTTVTYLYSLALPLKPWLVYTRYQTDFSIGKAMKTLWASGVLLGWFASMPAVLNAQELGQVISRSPVYQQVMVPRQTCIQVLVTQPAPSSGAGALMGAIAGGAMGNAVGDGSGRALATVIGIVGGAMVGNRIEDPNAAFVQNQTHCSTQNVYENRLVGYSVVYEYAGKQYTVQLPQDPGTTIPLQVTPLGQGLRSEGSSSAAPTGYSTLATVAPQVVYVPAPVYVSRPPVYSHIDLSWHSPRPVIRFSGQRNLHEHARSHRHATTYAHGHWR
jgi:uncharacterized protein YcfJ